MVPCPRPKPLPPILSSLFDPVPLRPSWANLPETIRTEARALLREMLRQHLGRRDGNEAREVGDE